MQRRRNRLMKSILGTIFILSLAWVLSSSDVPQFTSNNIRVLDTMKLENANFIGDTGVPYVQNGNIVRPISIVPDTMSEASLTEPYLSSGQSKIWERSSDSATFWIYRHILDSSKVSYFGSDSTVVKY